MPINTPPFYYINDIYYGEEEENVIQKRYCTIAQHSVSHIVFSICVYVKTSMYFDNISDISVHLSLYDCTAKRFTVRVQLIVCM